MLEYYYKGDVLETIQKVISKVEGSYALGIICADCPDRIFAVRKDSPLIIGIGEGGELHRFGCPGHPLPHSGTSTG